MANGFLFDLSDVLSRDSYTVRRDEHHHPTTTYRLLSHVEIPSVLGQRRGSVYIHKPRHPDMDHLEDQPFRTCVHGAYNPRALVHIDTRLERNTNLTSVFRILWIHDRESNLFSCYVHVHYDIRLCAPQTDDLRPLALFVLVSLHDHPYPRHRRVFHRVLR